MSIDNYSNAECTIVYLKVLMLLENVIDMLEMNNNNTSLNL